MGSELIVPTKEQKWKYSSELRRGLQGKEKIRIHRKGKKI